jgi:hypothetical protein
MNSAYSPSSGFRLSRIAAALIGAVVLAGSIDARAQTAPPLPDDVFFDSDVSPSTFRSLAARGVVPFVRQGPNQSGSVEIILPFDYPYLGAEQPFDRVYANSAGFITFADSSPLYNPFEAAIDGIPSAIQPNQTIAGFWSGLANVRIQTGVLGFEPERVFVIEYEGFVLDGPSASGAGNMQFWLYEDDRSFEIHYGGSISQCSMGCQEGIIGYERSGFPEDYFDTFGLTCSLNENCRAGNFNGLTGNRVRVAPVDAPELTVEFESFLSGALAGESADGELSLINRGQNLAPGVVVDLYLSLNENLNRSGDILVGSFTADFPNGRTARDVTIDIPMGTVPADYTLIADVDPPNPTEAFPEIDETDNIVIGPNFRTSIDLQPVACVVDPSNDGVVPNDPLFVDVTIRNNGAPFTGTVPVEIRFATAPPTPTTGQVIGTFTTSALMRVNEQTVRLEVPTPAAPVGEYFLGCRLDPTGTIPESDTTNNFVSGNPQAPGTGSFAIGADYVVLSVDGPESIVPGGMATFVTRLQSIAAPVDEMVDYQLYASEDEFFSLGFDLPLAPPFTVDFDGTRNQVVTDTQTFAIPDVTDIPGGQYFIIALIDPGASLDEARINNNTTPSTRRIPNGFDFTTSGLTFNTTATGNRVALDDDITVEVRLISSGPDFTGFVPARIYLSTDSTFDFGDTPVADFSIFVAGTGNGIEESTASTTFTLRSNVAPRCYNVAVRLNPDSTLPEFNEENNSFITPAIQEPCDAGPDPTTLELLGADLDVVFLTAPEIVLASQEDPPNDPIIRTFDTQLAITNTGESSADFVYTMFLSEDRSIRVTDDERFESERIVLAPNQTRTFFDTIEAPTLTSTQTLFLGVVADLNFEVPDTNRNDNVLVGGVITREGDTILRTPIRFELPAPDLSATLIGVPPAIGLGEEIAISRDLRNVGTEPTDPTTYAYYISDNPVIDPADDTLLREFDVDLDAGDIDIDVDRLVIPAAAGTGEKYLGVVVNPNRTVRELFLDNNQDSILVTIADNPFRIVTNALPRATLGAQYSTAFVAAGVGTPITWTLRAGALPPGLALDEDTGIIEGVPTELGTYEFRIRADAATAIAVRNYSITVTPLATPLTIATSALPSAVANRDYDEQLIAVGGAEPYTWSLANPGVLPPGLELTPAGRLTGRPSAAADVVLELQVEDNLPPDVRQTASGQVVLRVLNPIQTIQIDPLVLPSPGVGQELPCEEGLPFEFTTTNSIGDVVWSSVGPTPPGFSLLETGVFCGIAEEPGSFPFTVRAQDETGLTDTALFILRVRGSPQLAISTFVIPDGEEGELYPTVQLTATRGEEPYEWSLVEEGSTLPQGLEFTSEGRLQGTPGPGTKGVYGLLVQVADAEGGLAVGALTLTIDGPTFCERNPSNPLCDTSSGDSGGCATAPGTSNDSAWFLLGLAALLRSRRWWRRSRRAATSLGVASVLLVVLLSGRAEAQTAIPNTPYIRIIEDLDSTGGYRPLTSPLILAEPQTGGISRGIFDVNLPFSFRYYTADVPTVSVNLNGAVAMRAGINPFNFAFIPWAPNGVPPSGPFTDVNGWIAPAWGNLFLHSNNGSSVGFSETGVPGRRVFTIEWNAMGDRTTPDCCGNDLSYQVRLFEGPAGRIEIDWDFARIGGGQNPPPLGLTSGMENLSGTQGFEFPAASCSPNCSDTQLAASLDGKRHVYIQDAGVDLLALGFDLPPLFGIGVQRPVDVTYGNNNVAAQGPFTVILEADTDTTFDDPIFVGGANVSIAGYNQRTSPLVVSPPLSMPEGAYFIRMTVDGSDSVTGELSEENNIIVSDQTVQFIPGQPDLGIESVSTSTRAGAAGSQVTVTVAVSNGENALTVFNGFVSIVLSSNESISPTDEELDRFRVQLDTGERITRTLTVTLPEDLIPGEYFIGAFADLDDSLNEFNESNNGLAAPGPFFVRGGPLEIITPRLPTAILDEPYTAQLTAAGGSGNYEWRLSATSGPLPAGLLLDSQTGVISGSCTVESSGTVEIEVESNGETDTRSFTGVACISAEAPLRIIDSLLPTGVVGQFYQVALSAGGGRAENPMNLTWSAAASDLPPDLSLSDAGILEGPLSRAGQFAFPVTVNDGETTVQGTLSFLVREDARLLIDTVPVDDGVLGEVYNFKLSASGGVGTITFSLAGGDLPGGLVLNSDGSITGIPTSVGIELFRVRAQDNPPGGGFRAQDTNEFAIAVQDPGSGFQISTNSLPPAVLGEFYEVAISSVGGVPPITWTLVAPEEPDLPFGIFWEPDRDGSQEAFILGSAQSEARNLPLYIQAEDDIGRIAVRALALNALSAADAAPACPDPDFAEECGLVGMVDTTASGGCTDVGTGAGSTANLLLMLGAILGLGLLRRRRG